MTLGQTIATRRDELGLSQTDLAEALCLAADHHTITRTEVRKWENDKVTPGRFWMPYLADVLGLPLELLRSAKRSRPDAAPDTIDDVNRRELLRLTSLLGVLVTDPGSALSFDTERWLQAASGAVRVDAGTADVYATLNANLWQSFVSFSAKTTVLPLVREQLSVLTDALGQSPGPAMRKRLCALVSDLLQLAGEIHFDGNRYTDAAHFYALAATAGREADDFDLWACALTRQAFIGLNERQFTGVVPMLDLATRVAERGDGSKSTRYWVKSVQAQAFAGLQADDPCHRALDEAEKIQHLSGQVHNGGWLRFDGSRLSEERGTCLVGLGRPELAEPVLHDALRSLPPGRRRGGVLTNLATVGAQLRDPDRVMMYGRAALDIAKQTRSGYVAHRLDSLRPHLKAFGEERRMRELGNEISTLTVLQS